MIFPNELLFLFFLAYVPLQSFLWPFSPKKASPNEQALHPYDYVRTPNPIKSKPFYDERSYSTKIIDWLREHYQPQRNHDLWKNNPNLIEEQHKTTTPLPMLKEIIDQSLFLTGIPDNKFTIKGSGPITDDPNIITTGETLFDSTIIDQTINLPPEQYKHTVLHELGHLKHCDNISPYQDGTLGFNITDSEMESSAEDHAYRYLTPTELKEIISHQTDDTMNPISIKTVKDMGYFVLDDLKDLYQRQQEHYKIHGKTKLHNALDTSATNNIIHTHDPELNKLPSKELVALQNDLKSELSSLLEESKTHPVCFDENNHSMAQLLDLGENTPGMSHQPDISQNTLEKINDTKMNYLTTKHRLLQVEHALHEKNKNKEDLNNVNIQLAHLDKMMKKQAFLNLLLYGENLSKAKLEKSAYELKADEIHSQNNLIKKLHAETFDNSLMKKLYNLIFGNKNKVNINYAQDALAEAELEHDPKKINDLKTALEDYKNMRK